MPELPEVETVVQGLRDPMVGRVIISVTQRRADLRIPFPPRFDESLEKTRVTNISRRAKYILVHLDSAQVVLIHLGMSGTLRIMPKANHQVHIHDHIWWELDNGKRLVYRDPRRFGLMTLADENSLAEHPLLEHLGPEPLEDEFSVAYLKTALSKRSIALKVAIMDQKLVVGVGNIYASEALFRARVSPFLPANEVNAKQSKALHASIRQVLKEAIISGGSTLRDYVRSSGDAGYFQHSFTVYDRENEPCLICFTSVQRAVQAQRTTYFCKQCQNVNG